MSGSSHPVSLKRSYGAAQPHDQYVGDMDDDDEFDDEASVEGEASQGEAAPAEGGAVVGDVQEDDVSPHAAAEGGSGESAASDENTGSNVYELFPKHAMDSGRAWLPPGDTKDTANKIKISGYGHMCSLTKPAAVSQNVDNSVYRRRRVLLLGSSNVKPSKPSTPPDTWTAAQQAPIECADGSDSRLACNDAWKTDPLEDDARYRMQRSKIVSKLDDDSGESHQEQQRAASLRQARREAGDDEEDDEEDDEDEVVAVAPRARSRHRGKSPVDYAFFGGVYDSD